MPVSLKNVLDEAVRILIFIIAQLLSILFLRGFIIFYYYSVFTVSKEVFVFYSAFKFFNSKDKERNKSYIYTHKLLLQWLSSGKALGRLSWELN